MDLNKITAGSQQGVCSGAGRLIQDRRERVIFFLRRFWVLTRAKQEKIKAGNLFCMSIGYSPQMERSLFQETEKERGILLTPGLRKGESKFSLPKLGLNQRPDG